MMLLKNCRLLEHEELVDVLIEGGKIAKIEKNIPYSGDSIDIDGKLVMPGLIDSHVHFRDPGMTHKEDLYTGSCAAVAGGVTTFIDMPNNKPQIVTNEELGRKKKIAKEKSIANYGFHFGTSPQTDPEEVKKAADNNIASTKIFLNASTGNMYIEDYGLLDSIFSRSKIVSVHAEGRKKVRLAIQLAKKHKIPVYICHLSQKSELEEIKELRYNKSFIEVSPHHLFLTEKDASQFNIMKPELRTKEDQESLWQAIEEGIVDTIGTDHAPHLRSEKENGTIYGVTGIESMLPLLLDAYNKKRISLEKIQELCCFNPAKIFKIKNKGQIKKGFDADLTVIDLDKEKVVRNEELFTKAAWTPYNGMKLKGWPIMTIVNGNIVFKEGKITKDIKGKEAVFD